MISDLPIEEERKKEEQEPAIPDSEKDAVRAELSSQPDEDDAKNSEIEDGRSPREEKGEKDNGETTSMKAVSDMSEVEESSVGFSPGLDEKQTTIITQSGLKIRSDLYDSDNYSPEEYEEMARLYDESFANIAEGEVVQGTVMKIQGNSVILDVGFKSEGAVSLEEFTDPDDISVGDKVDVYLENLEDQEGVIVFSKKKADFLKVWDLIKQSYDNDEPIDGIISRKIKGGMVVSVLGVDAFLPGSQIDLRRVNDLDSMIGESYSFKIIKLNKRRRNVVVSRRIILEEKRETQRKKLLDEIEVGQKREGEVKNITDFGAFIDLGGVDGLLHITDMSWGRISHPSELVTIGDKLEVKVLDIDIERGRISLGLKQLFPYPWENIEEKYPVGKKVRGKVVSLTNYGAFIELEKGVEGLVHVSEMSWTRHIRHPSKILAIGDIVEAVVLSVDAQAEKISLGIKQIESDPWLSLTEKYPTGTHLEGKVRNLTSFGAFVEIEEGIDGLVHVSDMSWTRRIMHPSEVLKKGDKVEVVVLNIDIDNRRISLGLKQVQADPWEDLSTVYTEGHETTGKIARILDKGLVVDLGDDVEGFVPISQVARKTPRPLGVIECDQDNRRIVLTAEEVIQPDVEEDAAVVDEAPPEDDVKAEIEEVSEVSEASEEPTISDTEESADEPEISESAAESEAESDSTSEPEEEEEASSSSGEEDKAAEEK
jgi:small subunit ribosomal protein S1